MKFIGQHIIDMIARFRSDVYLDSPTAGGSDPDKFLGIDSDGKIIYRTGTQVASDIGAVTTETGDITGVTLTADDENVASDTAGSADFTIEGGSGITTSVSGTTVRVAGDDATTSAKGVASFSSSNFAVSSGAVTIKSGGVDLTDEVTGVLPVANTAAKVTSIVAGDGIDVSGATGDVTVTAETATASNPGVVELATTAEADSGTDTARAITAAGLKSHVDARYHYQYISFLGNSTVQANGDWEFPGGNGISNHTWTIDSNQSATTVGSTTISVAKQYQHAGVRVPYAGKLVGIYGAGRNSAADRTFSAGLFVGVPDWGTANAINATLRALATANNESGTFDNTAAKVEDLTRDFDLSAGDMIYPAIKGSGTNADTIQISMTVVIKTLIP